MGNRATINVKGDTKQRGAYVHWQGGAGSIAGFLRETKLRLGRDFIYRAENDADDIEADITTFYAVFYSVARDFFCYAGSFKDRSPMSIYLEGHDVSNGAGDNGCFTIENDFTCSRINTENLNDYDSKSYAHMHEFYEDTHAAMSAVCSSESDDYRAVAFTEAELNEQLARAQEIEKNAQARVARIEGKLAALAAEKTPTSLIGKAIQDYEKNQVMGL